jgi:hypothetical protein
MLGKPDKLQRRISRAFIAKPDARLTTMELVRWCYPRLKEPVSVIEGVAFLARADLSGALSK